MPAGSFYLIGILDLFIYYFLELEFKLQLKFAGQALYH
jgi:hypothetical protein